MTPQEAADLAARTLAAIDHPGPSSPWYTWADRRVADRERVASDLAGIEACHVMSLVAEECEPIGSMQGHAARYAAGLIRTARLYGVTP